jgi:hypothetical protein
MNSQTVFTAAESASGLAVYEPYRAQLAELRAHNAAVVFDYEDPAGNKEARSHIYKLRRTKTGVDDARKAAGKDALEYKRKVDAQGKEIIAEIESMIQLHAKPLEEIEQRERDRVSRHQMNLQEIVSAGARSAEGWQTLPLDAMKERLAEIDAEPTDAAHWQEFCEKAKAAKENTLSQMRDAISRREQFDAEQAELAELRRQQAEREQRDREEAIAKQAAKEASRKAEEEAKRQAELAARREQDLQNQVADANRAAEQAAETARLQLEEAARRSEEERIKRESNRRHLAKINNEIVDAVCALGATREFAMLLTAEIARNNVPHVKINY